MGLFDGLFSAVNNFAATTFWFIVVVGVLVFVHESGHFLTAKAFGMRVEVFSLGFGQRLFGRRRGGTDYRVSLIPLGGYVKLAGGEELMESPDEPLPPDYFLSRPRWQRFLVLFMGPAVNLVLAVFLFGAAFMLGVQLPAPSEPLIHKVDEGAPAQRAGLLAGDRIVAVDGAPIESWDEVRNALWHAGLREVKVDVDRGGEVVALVILPEFTEDGIPRIGARVSAPAIVSNLEPDMPAIAAGLLDDDRIVAIDGEVMYDFRDVAERIRGSVGVALVLGIQRGAEQLDIAVTPVKTTLPDGTEGGRIGFAFKAPMMLVQLAPGPAMRRALATSLEQAGVLFSVLKHLLSFDMPFRSLSGPIEIARVTRAVARDGTQLLTWMAFISLQLGILNLLPVPMLDGGHIFILLTEGVLRRDLSMRVKEMLNQVGFLLLICLMLAVVVQDISKAI